MAKLIKFGKQKNKAQVSSPGYRSVRVTRHTGEKSGGAGADRGSTVPRSAVPRRAATRSTRTRRAAYGTGRQFGGLKRFLRRNIRLIAIGGIAVVIAVLCLVLFLGGPSAPASTEPTDDVAVVVDDPGVEPAEGELSESDDPFANADFDIDYTEFMTEEEMAEMLLAEEGLRIGITVGNLRAGEDEAVINRMEEVWSEAKASKEILDAYYYNANGKANQQLQDIRSLINKEVDVIITAFMDREGYEMVTTLAARHGIPVVAYDAPVAEGYAINIVPDQDAWGSAYGQFMTQRLSAGNVVKVFDSQDNARSAARHAALDRALASGTQLTLADTAYAGHDAKKAKDAVAKLLTDGKQIDGVIVEEGMAEAVLNAFIDARKLPKVMCGDLTVGFLKKWYALKNGGIDVTPKAEKNQPTPAPVFFEAQPGEFIVCAQPSPTAGAAAAFEIAVEIAKGRTLKTAGQTYRFTVKTLVTDAELATYYNTYKDYENSYTISEAMTETMLNTLLNPPEAAA